MKNTVRTAALSLSLIALTVFSIVPRANAGSIDRATMKAANCPTPLCNPGVADGCGIYDK